MTGLTLGKRAATALIAVALGSFGATRSAEAGLFLTINSGSSSATASGTSFAFFSGPVGDFTVNVTASTTSPGTATSAQTSDLVFSINNMGAAGSVGTITFGVSSDGFTAPGSPGTAEFFNSQFVSSNAPNAQSITFSSTLTQSGPAITLGPQGANTFLSTPFTRNSVSFSLSNITTVTLAAGESVNTTGTSSVTLTQPIGSTGFIATPEPGTMALVLAGLPILGLRYMRRRRVSAAA